MPKPTDQYDMPAQAAAATRRQQASMDARAGQLRQEAATKSLQENLNRNTQPLSTSHQPPIIIGGPYPGKPSRPSKPTASSGSKGLFGIAALVALLTALAFYALPQIHNYFGGYTGNSYIAVVVVASLIASGATMLVIGAIVTAIEWVRNNPLKVAVFIALLFGAGYIHYFR